MNSMKCRIQLADIRPSEGNPRQDMGDLEQLAHSIAATGGEPVNPLIVVRDGSIYRLVDGERRYRALKMLDATEADCIVFMDFPEAMEAIAAMATDDKKLLTDEERSRGFQTMLVLGVEEGEGAAAAGIEVEQFRRARRAAKAIKPETARIPGLEALIVAGDDDFTDEEMVEIIDAETSGGGVAYVAEGIRRRKRNQANAAAIIEALPEEVDVYASQAAMRDAAEGKGLALTFRRAISKPKDAPDGAGARAYDGSTLAAYAEGSFVCVYEMYEDGEDDQDADEAAESARAEEISARNAAIASLHATWEAAIARDPGLLAALDQVAVEARSMPLWADAPEDGDEGALRCILEDAIGSSPSMWERAQAFGEVIRYTSLDADNAKASARALVAAYDALADVGAWEPTDDDEALRDYAVTRLGGADA
ncbi:MAG: ParB N-terminal domain-containing protein [Olsenella sp.]|nr:ParB N-terminal domain-containing protein [Olsenella sp.]